MSRSNSIINFSIIVQTLPLPERLIEANFRGGTTISWIVEIHP